jgi:uncharacterized protein (DUF1015 family)
LIAPPYDVISPAERARFAALDAHNIVHVMLPEAADGDRYAHAAKLLAAWRSDGTLVRDGEPSVYVLAQDYALPSGERKSRVGVFVALAAEGYEPRRVRPHERTHAGPKADRLALLRATRTSLESIFVIAPDADGSLARALREIASQPAAANAELAGVAIRLWVVQGGAAADLARLVSAAPVYMADGHHRYETASTYATENAAASRLLTFVVSAKDQGLTILPTHRVIYGAPVEPTDVAAEWGPRLEVSDLAPDAPREANCWIVAWPGERRQRLVPNPPWPPLSEMELIAMGDYIVRSIVQHAGTAQLVYTPDAREAVGAVTKSGASAAVLLPAPKVATVFEVADANGIMPPKSTYFFPKVPAGLVIFTP